MKFDYTLLCSIASSRWSFCSASRMLFRSSVIPGVFSSISILTQRSHRSVLGLLKRRPGKRAATYSRHLLRDSTRLGGSAVLISALYASQIHFYVRPCFRKNFKGLLWAQGNPSSVSNVAKCALRWWISSGVPACLGLGRSTFNKSGFEVTRQILSILLLPTLKTCLICLLVSFCWTNPMIIPSINDSPFLERSATRVSNCFLTLLYSPTPSLSITRFLARAASCEGFVLLTFLLATSLPLCHIILEECQLS